MKTDDNIRLNFIINGDSARKEMLTLDKEAAKLAKSIKGVEKNTDEYASKSRRLDEIRKRQEQLTKAMDISKMTMKQLASESKRLRSIRDNLEPGSKEFLKVNGRINDVNGRMKELMHGSKKTSSVLTSMAKRFAAVFAVGSLISGIRSVIRARDEELQKTAELRAALKGNEEVTRRLVRVAGEMQRVTGISDEAIKGHMAFLGLQGRNETQIKNTMKAAVDLSKVMGIGLLEAVKMVDATFEGSIGRLNRLDQAFGQLTREQLQNGEAIDMINAKYGGQAAESFRAGMGGLRAFQLALGDIQKTLGMALVNGLSPFFQGFADLINSIDSSLRKATQSSKDLFDDQLNSVVDLTTGISPLLDRYDELKTKTNLSTNEQQELADIIRAVSDAIPSAVNGFNEYGEAISLSTDRAKQFINTEVSRLQVVNQESILQTEKAIKTRERLIANSTHRIKQIEEQGFYEITEKVYSVGLQREIDQTRRASQEEIAETIQKHQTLTNEVRGYQAELSRLNGNFLVEAQQEREKQLEAEREADAERVEYSKKTLTELRTLATDGDELAKSMLETRKDEVEATTSAVNAYDALKRKLAEMQSQLRHFVATGNEFEAEAAATVIKELQGKIEALEAEISRLMSNEPKTPANNNTPSTMPTGGGGTDYLDEQHNAQLARQQEILGAKLEIYEAEEAREKELAQIRKDIHKRSMDLLKETGIQTVYGVINLIEAYQQNNFDQKMDELDAWREKQLVQENLTEAQKAKIQEQYEKKRSKLQAEQWKKQRNADIIRSVIDGSLAVTRALASPPGFPLNAPFVVAAGVQAAAQTALIAAQPVPQFAKGRYLVRGASDGKNYNAPFIGAPKTGYYSKPALFAETGGEIIIDPKTTRNIMVNYPGIMDAIHRARVPQYATGNLPGNAGADPSGSLTLTNEQQAINLEEIRNDIKAAVNELSSIKNSLLRGDVKSQVSLFDIETMQDKRDNAESETSY